ncbi:hypothetical protein ACFOWX_13295, partial [Sphingorhabdus arenilitoris]
MVSIFAGLGAGYTRGSGNIIGAAGQLGGAAQGRGGDLVSVNAATGNLLISRQDEFLVGRGPDVGINRTYNSQLDAGWSDNDNGDQWQQSTTRRVFGLTGTLNAAGSTIKRQAADGSVITYTWNASHQFLNGATSTVTTGAYVTTDGDGAHDIMVRQGNDWLWIDGASQTR